MPGLATFTAFEYETWFWFYWREHLGHKNVHPASFKPGPASPTSQLALPHVSLCCLHHVAPLQPPPCGNSNLIVCVNYTLFPAMDLILANGYLWPGLVKIILNAWPQMTRQAFQAHLKRFVFRVPSSWKLHAEILAKHYGILPFVQSVSICNIASE